MNKGLGRYFPLFILPTLIAFVIAFLIPFLLGIWLSFTQFTTISDSTFVGFANYREIFSGSSDFLNALWFTLKFTIVSVISVNFLAFIFAMILTRGIRGTRFFRTILFTPNLIGGIVLGYIWQLILNGFLMRLGVDITYAAKYGFWGLVLIMNWQMIGYMMVIYIAGLQSIPEELKESAQMDGAGIWGNLRHVILPLMSSSFTICLFLTLTNSFKLFDQNFALTNGAPGKETAMLALDIYKTFYGRVGSEGIGQAKAVLFFVLVSLIALVQFKFSGRYEVRQR